MHGKASRQGARAHDDVRRDNAQSKRSFFFSFSLASVFAAVLERAVTLVKWVWEEGVLLWAIAALLSYGNALAHISLPICVFHSCSWPTYTGERTQTHLNTGTCLHDY